MKLQHLNSLLAALLMAASYGAASAYAFDSHGVVGAGTPPIQAGATVVAGPDLDLTDDLPANFRVTPNMNLDADSVDPAAVEATAGSIDVRSEDLDTDPLSARTDVDQYSFGWHINL
jgi:hypothetical protein